MGMTIEQAWFVLEHGSAEGLKVYVEAIRTIKKNCVDIVRCNDCKNRFDGCCYNRKSDRTNFGVFVANDWFCADGERRDDDA